jgi:ABC-type transporter Mla MlaB component
MATETVILDCARIEDTGLYAVELIARATLEARHAGRELVVRNPSNELLELLDLVGLSAYLAVEVKRQPE